MVETTTGTISNRVPGVDVTGTCQSIKFTEQAFTDWRLVKIVRGFQALSGLNRSGTKTLMPGDTTCRVTARK